MPDGHGGNLLDVLQEFVGRIVITAFLSFQVESKLGNHVMIHCFNPHCASTRGNACIHNAVGLSEFLFVYYRFYFGEGSLLDAKGVKQLL